MFLFGQRQFNFSVPRKCITFYCFCSINVFNGYWLILGVAKPAWNHQKTSQAGLAWLVNSRRGHWLGFDLAFRQATHHDYI